ncbi:3-oxoadipate enol-lactonase, partial [Streptomyces sp. SM8]
PGCRGGVPGRPRGGRRGDDAAGVGGGPGARVTGPGAPHPRTRPPGRGPSP